MRCLAATLAALATATLPLAAQDSSIVGPRALGMGGTGVASTDDQTAAFYNPGMYGFFGRTDEKDERLPSDPNFVGRKDWGVGLVDFTAQVEVRGKLADYVQQLSSVDVSKLQSLGSVGTPDPDTLKAAMVTVGLLGQFKPSTDFVTVNANAGVLNTRIGHFGIGARGYMQSFVSIADLDTTNIGFGSASVQDIVADINTSTPTGYTSSHTPTLITGANQAVVADAMAQALGAANYAALSGAQQTQVNDAISRLDYAAGQAGMTTSDITAIAGQASSILPAAIVSSSGAGTDINNNTSAIFVGGVGWSEVPLTLGWALNDHISIGGSAKLMIGEVAAAKARVMANTDNIATYVKDAMKDSIKTVTGGVDLGVVIRAPHIQLGLTGRNLNRPIFKGGEFTDLDGKKYVVDDVPIDPQATAGLALYPWETFCITGDLDLTESTSKISTTNANPASAAFGKTLSVEYKNRHAGAGVEWNILRTLALRAGAYKNIADSESSLTYTGGLGVNLYLVRLDIAGAMSTDKITVDGTEVPKSAAVSAGLTIDF